MKAQSNPSAPLVFECDLDEPPEKVWRALTEPRLLETWLTADDSARSEYEILTAEPHRRLRYRWRDHESGVGDSDGREVHSVVTIELAPAPAGGTHLRLTHGEFRIVSVTPSAAAFRVRPITSSARRRHSPEPALFARHLLLRAA